MVVVAVVGGGREWWLSGVEAEAAVSGGEWWSGCGGRSRSRSSCRRRGDGRGRGQVGSE